MYSNYSMRNPSGYYSHNNQRGITPFLLGGVLGYGIGVSTRPRFYPVPIFPVPHPPFRPPMGQPIFIYPPFWRKR